MKKFNKFIKKYWKLILLSNGLMLLSKFIELAQPQVLGGAINYVQEALKTRPAKFDIIPYALVYVLFAALGSLTARRRGITNVTISSSLMKDIRCDVYDKLMKLQFSYYGKTSSGQIISRVTHDVNVLRGYFDTIMFLIPDIAYYMIGATAMMLLIDVKLTLLGLCTLPVTAYMMIKTRRALKKLWRRCDDVYGDVATVLQENISGVRVVKSFAKENHEIDKFTGKVKVYRDSWMQAFGHWVKHIPFTEFIFNITVPLTLFYGGYLVMGKVIEVGDLTKFFLYLTGFGSRLERIGRIVNSIENANAAGERLSDILDTELEIKETEEPRKLPLKGEIVFDNVSFAYNKGKNVLSGINLTIHPGETLGITGPTGSGKTSLINLLPRFYDVDSGKIMIDGSDIRDFNLKQLRKSIGMAFQESFLFSATVAENIAYGCADINHENIKKTAGNCRAAEFIENLKDRYDTIIGERGVTLSGGQKQRIAIARAIIIEPGILIFDNPTSSLDSETERLIMADIHDLGITTIIISQKLSVLNHCGRIVTLEEGKITDIGTHNELISRSGFYKQIYEEQINRVNIN